MAFFQIYWVETVCWIISESNYSSAGMESEAGLQIPADFDWTNESRAFVFSGQKKNQSYFWYKYSQL